MRCVNLKTFVRIDWLLNVNEACDNYHCLTQMRGACWFVCAHSFDVECAVTGHFCFLKAIKNSILPFLQVHTYVSFLHFCFLYSQKLNERYQFNPSIFYWKADQWLNVKWFVIILFYVDQNVTRQLFHYFFLFFMKTKFCHWWNCQKYIEWSLL